MIIRNHLVGTVIGLVLLSAVLAGAASAQPVVDQLVLMEKGQYPGLYYALMNASRPILRKQPAQRFGALRVAHGNMRFITADAVRGDVYYVNTSGAIQLTLTTLPKAQFLNYSRIELDQDGSYVIRYSSASPYGNYTALFRLRGRTLSTLSTLVPYGRALTRDQDTGDFLVGAGIGSIQRVDRVTGQLRTLYSGVGTITDLAYNPVNGSIVVARTDPAWGLIIYHRNSPWTWRIPFRSPTCVTVDPIRGYIYAANRYGEVLWADATGRVIKTWDFGSYIWDDVAIWGSQRISTTASGQAGTKQFVSARFHLSPNLPYQCALSLGHRPGIPVSNRTLFLQPDALFFTTVFNLVPGLTERFSGHTNSVGYANPAFTIPAVAPAGLRIYFGMAVANRVYSGGLDVSNVECIKVR